MIPGKKTATIDEMNLLHSILGAPPGFKISGSMGSNKGNKTLSHANFVIAG